MWNVCWCCSPIILLILYPVSRSPETVARLPLLFPDFCIPFACLIRLFSYLDNHGILFFCNMILFLLFWSCSPLSHPVFMRVWLCSSCSTSLCLFLVCVIQFLACLVMFLVYLHSMFLVYTAVPRLSDPVPRLPDPALVRLIIFLVDVHVPRPSDPVLVFLILFLVSLLVPNACSLSV